MDDEQEAAIQRLGEAGHPVVTITVEDEYALGGESSDGSSPPR